MEFCRWRAHLAEGETVISSPDVGYNVSSFVHAATPEAQIIVEEHDPRSSDLHRRLFLWGEKGFVSRPASEARISR